MGVKKLTKVPDNKSMQPGVHSYSTVYNLKLTVYLMVLTMFITRPGIPLYNLKAF